MAPAHVVSLNECKIFALSLGPRSCAEAEAWVHSTFASPQTRRQRRGRPCCCRGNGRKCCITRGAQDRPHSPRPGARDSRSCRSHRQVPSPPFVCSPPTVMSPACDVGQVGGGLCAKHQINLTEVDGNEKLGDGQASVRSTERENSLTWLVVVVWWLRTMAKSLGRRMSSRSTSNTRNEPINLAFVSQKEKK